ncbi:MAG: hypothetical protein GY930_03920 [bacterium]|nr:hypothetical protein [bacterium]
MLHHTPPPTPNSNGPRATGQTHPAQRVQVIERWNQWVRVRFDGSPETTWVDLEETPYATDPKGSRKKNSKN